MLAEPDVGTVIINVGMQDLLNGASAPAVKNAYSQLATVLRGFGITVIFATLTPCLQGSSPSEGSRCGASPDGGRQTVNAWIANNATQIAGQPFTFEADFDCAISNQQNASPPCTGNESLLSADDGGDHLNLSVSGYAATTRIITVADLEPVLPAPGS